MPDRRSAILALLVLLAGCTTVGPPISWQSAVGRDHPLVGRIWDVRRARPVDEATMLRDLAEARFVLLGETHDNPDHHALQARVVRALVDAGRRPIVAFEMLTPSQRAALERHRAAHPSDSVGLGPAVGWEQSGWPEWAWYEPIARVALEAGLPILPANLDADRVRALRREGVSALDPAFVHRHAFDAALADDVRTAMSDEIREAHCGHAPAAMLPGMIAVQRARDAAMADALTAGDDGGVLIAGSGHVRTDRGVPAYLQRLAPRVHTASLAFVEVDPKRVEATRYAERLGGTLPFDYVWFTPAVDAEDPCEKFRKTLERLRR